jgi:hypothetical protein
MIFYFCGSSPRLGISAPQMGQLNGFGLLPFSQEIKASSLLKIDPHLGQLISLLQPIKILIPFSID